MSPRSPQWLWTCWPALSCSRFLTDQTRDSTSGWAFTGGSGIYCWEIFTGLPSLQRPGMRGGGGLQDPQLLRDVRHEQRGPGDGEDGGGDEDPHQRGHQGPAGPGGRLQVRVPRAARPRGNDDVLHCQQIVVFCFQPKRGHLESWWLIGPDTEPLGEEPANQEAGLALALGD